MPYCEWQDVRAGPYGYNGFHFLSIVDFANPAPRNNHFWHYHRKVLMDQFAQHPDRVGTGTGGRVCNSNTNTYYNYRDGNFNTVNMWISGMPNWNNGPGGLPGNSQWFMTSCSGGAAENQLSSAAELQPELMPNEPNQWPAGSSYPDYFVIGDLYTNVYEGSASLTDIKLFVPDTAPPPTNLALNKPATASNQCAATEAPAKAVNGSWTGGNADKWCALGSNKWLQVDLQSNQTVGKVVLRHSAAGGEKASWNTRDFDVQVSTDGTTWTNVATVRGNTADTTTHTFTPRAVRYIRLNVITPTSDTDTAARIYELEAYAS